MIEEEGGKVFKDKQCCLGIDEAGRGPVLGPMVYACCYWPIEFQDANPELFKAYVDSKKTTEKEREGIYKKIAAGRDEGLLNYKYFNLDPNVLSNDQLGNVRNLNEISHDTAIALIEATIKEGTDLKEVYVDTVGPPDKYKKKLENYFAGSGISFVVESKADDSYRCVSAASIVAKFHRDAFLKNWEFVEPGFKDPSHKVFGCGYPGDDITKEWLKEHYDKVFGFPTIVRFSWSTCDRFINDQKMKPDSEKISCYFPCQKIKKESFLTESYMPNTDEKKALEDISGPARVLGLQPF
ncbi:unnamed protein product [Moneuplotes crassus]|uniref:Ribonuclease n=2 Tax=Euplotes crassus TaxID=5936 RepID=A0AAD1XJ76_EUPCR|nr:unnamed protein product [Moneuplotes crassus]